MPTARCRSRGNLRVKRSVRSTRRWRSGALSRTMNETIAERSSGSPSMSYMTASKAPMRSCLGCMGLILDQRPAVRVGFARQRYSEVRRCEGEV